MLAAALLLASLAGPARAAPDALSTATPDYFASVYPNLLRAPLPGQIYRQGGIPAVVGAFESFADPLGRVGSYLPGGAVITAGHPFFQALGSNGRSCATCHQPASGMSISIRNVRARFQATLGRDPLFAPVDGANCPDAIPPGRAGRRMATGAGSLRAAHSVILDRAAIRIPLPWPPRSRTGAPKRVEFDLAIQPWDDRPGCNTDATYGLAAGFVSVYRRPPSAAQMNFKTLRVAGRGRALPGSIMWDGREPSLEQLAIDATRGHAQALHDPTAEQVRRIVEFTTGTFAAQLIDGEIGRLDGDGGGGGPVNLAAQLPFPATGFTFLDYANWAGRDGKQGSVARGQALFTSRTFAVGNVDGFNDLPGVGNPSGPATCSTCHASFASGAEVLFDAQKNIGVSGTGVASGGPAAARDLPRFTLTCHADAIPGFAGPGPIVTNDPGLALITGKCADIGRFTVPPLRALAAREPYFHDGSAQSLADVVAFYNTRFAIGFTEEEQQDLANFLAAL